MKISKILESYKENQITDPRQLDLVAVDLKKITINFLSERYLTNHLKNVKTIDTLKKKFENLIKVEHNTLNIPYYYILENINLCLEVEKSSQIIENEDKLKFGELKFSQIMENGLTEKEHINRFMISEKSFLNDILSFVSDLTKDIEVNEEFIKIELN
jgi:hypothetical protein